MLMSILLAAQVASGQLPPAQPIPPPDFETANVLAPIQQLFATFAAGDSAASCASLSAGREGDRNARSSSGLRNKLGGFGRVRHK